MSKNSPGNELASLRELQRFLDATIHDLRAPLRGIGTSAALLRERWIERSDEETKDRLKSILDGVARIENLAKSLAEYSMALLSDGFAAVELPIAHALQSALVSLESQIKESRASVHSGVLPEIVANHEQLIVLFRCLLSNALEYHGSAAPRIEIDATKSGDKWRFTCSDNGIGIAPQYQQQVFEPFQRLHGGSRGVGLGLTICKKIVEAHGGEISLESQEGQGTKVIFTLPTNYLSGRNHN
jgi:two-component system sensor histidine kinase/response regulator